MAADLPLRPGLDKCSYMASSPTAGASRRPSLAEPSPTEGASRRHRLVKDCMDRLVEAEGLLAGVRRAEEAVAQARQALAGLSGEAAWPSDPATPGKACGEESPSHAKAAGEERPAALGSPLPLPPQQPEPQSEQQQPQQQVILDQAIVETMNREFHVEVEEDLSPPRRSSLFGRRPSRSPRQGTKDSLRRTPSSLTLSEARGWNNGDLRRGFICKPYCCTLEAPIFFPDCKYTLVWDLMGLFFIIFETFALPVYLSFGVEPTGLSFWFVSLVNLYFIVDIVFNFLRGFKGSNGFVIMDPEKIWRRYVKYVVLDILAGIPWEWLNPILNSHRSKWAQLTKMLRLLRIARLLRLMRLQVLPEFVKMYIESNSWLTFVNGVIRVLFCLFSITHWAACIWFYIGSNSDSDKTWIDAHLPKDADFETEYMYSLYFTLTTMTTVGYGDITPQNNDEVLFTLILLLVATVVFATLMGALTDLICSLQGEKHQEAARVRMLSHYMNWRRVPEDLFKAVRKHMLYLWDNNKGYDAYEIEVKDSLPPVLRRELSFHVYGRILRSVTFLAWLWDYEVPLKELANAVHSLILSRGDWIFRNGQPNTKVFVLQSGFVRISLNERLSFRLQEGEDDEDQARAEEEEAEDLSPSKAMPNFADAFRLPGRSPRTFSKDISFGGRSTPSFARRSETQDLFQSKVLLSAVEKQQTRDQKEKWAACYIQRLWQSVKRRRKKGRKKEKRRSIMTRTVEAPSYFGEACLWEPFESWSSDNPPTHTYSTCCESLSEIMIIPRTEVQQVLWRFSPWLKDRFESFRQDVLVGHVGQLDEDGNIERSVRSHTDSNVCSPVSPLASPNNFSDTDRSVEEIASAAGEQLAALASRSRAAASRLMEMSRGQRPHQPLKGGGVMRVSTMSGGSGHRQSWATLREPLMKTRSEGSPGSSM